MREVARWAGRVGAGRFLVKMGKKAPVSEDFNRIEIAKRTTVCGGWLKKPMVLPVMTVLLGDQSAEFAHIDRNADWINACIAGPKEGKRNFGRCKIFDDLRDKLRIATLGDDCADDTHGDGDAQDLADPMNALDMDGVVAAAPSTEKQASDRKKPTVPRATKRVATVIRVVMPERCREAEPDNNTTREVTLWVKDKRQVWLGVDHLQWFMDYLRKQYDLGGVSVLREDPGDAGKDFHVSAVAETLATPPREIPIAWDFEKRAWSIAPRPDVTPEGKTLKPSDLTLERVAVVDKEVKTLDGVPYKQKKDLAYKYMAHWAENARKGLSS